MSLIIILGLLACQDACESRCEEYYTFLQECFEALQEAGTEPVCFDDVSELGNYPMEDPVHDDVEMHACESPSEAFENCKDVTEEYFGAYSRSEVLEYCEEGVNSEVGLAIAAGDCATVIEIFSGG